MHIRMIVAMAAAVLAAGCSPIVDTRGHSTDAEDFKQIIANQSTQDDVRAVLGSPSATSTYGDETWYYITERRETQGMMAPEITDHHVYAIRFNENHVVADISEYSKDEGKPVDYVSKTTPTEGNRLTFMKQLFGNFGRFGTPGRSIESKNLGH